MLNFSFRFFMLVAVIVANLAAGIYWQSNVNGTWTWASLVCMILFDLAFGFWQAKAIKSSERTSLETFEKILRAVWQGEHPVAEQLVGQKAARSLMTIHEKLRREADMARSYRNRSRGAWDQLSSKTEHIQSVTRKVETLIAKHKEMQNHANRAGQLTQNTANTVSEGEAVVARTVAAMAAISEGSQKVNEIIDGIQAIAFKTNLACTCPDCGLARWRSPPALPGHSEKRLSSGEQEGQGVQEHR